MRRLVATRWYVSAAVAGGVVSALATYFVVTLAAPTMAQTAPTQRTEVLTQALADVPGREVRIMSLDLAPGHASAPHRHPGHHVFGYIVEGTYEWAISDAAPKIFKPGEVFYEPPGVLHAVSKNASATDRAKIVVFMVADQKQPTTVSEPTGK